MGAMELRTLRHGAVISAAIFTAGVTEVRAQGVRSTRPAIDAPAATADIDATERALYDASRRAPRNPAARAALGEWLASRGQLRSGAVLLEEARLFGGEASAIAARLVHIYTWLGDWASLAALPAAPLVPAEKRRATALADRAREASGEDTTVVPFAPLEIGALGRVPLVLGSDTIWAEIDPQEEGVVLPGLGRGAGLIEILGDDRRGAVGVIREVALGAVTLHAVPVRIDGALAAGRGRLGFDLFARLAPTVDARAGTVTLRRAGRVAEREGVRVPMLLTFPGVQLVVRIGERSVGIASPAGRAALRGRMWTVDVRRGVIWLDAAR